VVEQPAELGAGKIRIEQQPGFLAEVRRASLLFQRGAEVGGAAILPDDGAVQRPAGAAVPEQRRLALVGQADRRDVFAGEIGLGHGAERGAARGLPQIARVVFDPAGPRVVLGEFLLRAGHGAAAPVKDDRAGGSGALVEGKDVGHGVEEV